MCDRNKIKNFLLSIMTLFVNLIGEDQTRQRIRDITLEENDYEEAVKAIQSALTDVDVNNDTEESEVVAEVPAMYQ